MRLSSERVAGTAGCGNENEDKEVKGDGERGSKRRLEEALTSMKQVFLWEFIGRSSRLWTHGAGKTATEET